jgi:hypothetical protein
MRQAFTLTFTMSSQCCCPWHLPALVHSTCCSWQFAHCCCCCCRLRRCYPFALASDDQHCSRLLLPLLLTQLLLMHPPTFSLKAV